MGILNVTPDSFSDGGHFLSPDKAIERGKKLFDDGANWVDVGGESTRPGSEPVSTDEELRRVLNVVEKLSKFGKVSIDTMKPEVAAKAIESGATMVNDVTGLRNPAMLEVVKLSGVQVCIMHMKGEPKTMQDSPEYTDVVEEVWSELKAQAARLESDNVWLDPGIGFGKTVEHNLELLRNLSKPIKEGLRVVVGASRKSFIGKVSGETDPLKRLPGSLAVAIASAQQGVHMLRVHDVAETRQALAIYSAIRI